MRHVGLARLAGVLLIVLCGAMPLVGQGQTIKLASVVPAGSIWDRELQRLAVEAKQGTEGRVAITVFNGGAQGDEPSVLRKMRLDTLQAASFSVVGLAGIDQAFNVFNLPFFFDSYDELNAVVDKMTPVLATKPWKTGMAKMTWDAIRATDVLLERPEVDPARLCSIGHSLGGKEVLYHAAFDERVKAAVSCEGGVGVTFSTWDADWYLGKQVKKPEWQAAGRDHHELMALIAPRALLVLGGDGKDGADGAKSWPYVEATLPLWKLLGAEQRLGLMRHGRGHDFLPPGEQRERVYRWLDHWVAAE